MTDGLGPIARARMAAWRDPYADVLRDVKLCTRCAHWWESQRDAQGRLVRHIPCGSLPDAKRLRDARRACNGELWEPKP
jgi:hypothetical protein